ATATATGTATGTGTGTASRRRLPPPAPATASNLVFRYLNLPLFSYFCNPIVFIISWIPTSPVKLLLD
ncbi:MAG: hypothetical protein ACKOGP_09850, partial [Bacteroidota bacterium]